MKLNKFALTLTAAALLPTFASASTDEVVASFERDLHRGASIELPMIAQAEADPLDIINSILNREPDAIVASFDRDLYHEADTFAAVIPADVQADPLAGINVAFRSEPDAILASFQRDLYRVPTFAPMVASNEVDPLLVAVSNVLWSEMANPAVHVALVNGYGYAK